jgi:hypothetical protein
VFIGHDAMHFTNLWALSDGKVISITSYGDHAEALTAAGLRE